MRGWLRRLLARRTVPVPAPARPRAATAPPARTPPPPRPGPAPPAGPPTEELPLAAPPGGRTIHVHADRIDDRPGPRRLTPSEAVRLASDGPEALHRARGED